MGRKHRRRSAETVPIKGGRPSYPTVLMVKILVLKQLYNLIGEALEYQLLDRSNFLQFLNQTWRSSISGH